MSNNKVVLIGCGNVGMSYVYALFNQRCNVHELVLIDINKEKVEGEVMDLNHCLAFSPSKINIKSGDYSDCKDATIVCITAGQNQKEGETRLDLINKNSKIFKSIVENVMASGFNGIFLVATNPVDVMTHLTWKYSGLDSKKVIGSGTSLDTSRLRYLIAEKIDVNPENVHAYVIGEHGDSEFVPWSNATVGLQPIKEFIAQDEAEEIHRTVRDAAYDIIKKKGATYYGIGMCLVKITKAILGNENSIVTVSSYQKDDDVFIGMPSVINKKGVRGVCDITLNADESKKLHDSINVIKSEIDKICE